MQRASIATIALEELEDPDKEPRENVESFNQGIVVD